MNKNSEILSNWTEASEKIIEWTKKSLSLLKIETRKKFFKDSLNWLKKTFWFWEKSEWKNQISEKSEKPNVSKVDTSWFSPGKYPFAHIKYPYKWISAYRVDNIKLNPLIWFSQLSLKWTEWPLYTLNVRDQKLNYTNKKSAWYKKNNPCNVSPYKWDIWRINSSKVADWQNHWKYKTMEDWIASFMKLMRQQRYRNKSIQWINCSGMQWIYKENEPDSLKALRITWITHTCEKLNISPFQRLNTDDKETIMAFAQQTAINETWSYLDRAILERAYNKAFW